MKTTLMPTWNRERFLTLLDSGQLLPSLSSLTVQLMQLSSEEDCSVNDIAALIEKDPSLTVRVLRLANSVFFKPRYPITTVRAAVLRIGIYQTRILALSLSLKDTFPLGKVGSVDYGYYWRLSLYQGLLAKFLAGQENPEEAFTAAFTLEIGLLVFLHAFLDPTDGVEMPLYPLSSLLEWQNRRYGVNHRDIGEVLLTHWGFPSKMTLCQRSHQFGRAAAGLPPLAKICAVASHLSAGICQAQAYLPEVFRTVEQTFGLSLPLVVDAMTTALVEVDSIAEMFEVEIDSEEDKLEVMRKAHYTLALLSQKLLKGQSLAQRMVSLADLHERPGDSSVRHALQAVEHEIKNPLRAIGAFATRLAEEIDADSDQGHHIRIILSEAARLEQSLKGIEQALRQ